MNHEVRESIMPLQVEVSELNDLRCLQAAEGYIELGMYDEADAEIAASESNFLQTDATVKHFTASNPQK